MTVLTFGIYTRAPLKSRRIGVMLHRDRIGIGREVKGAVQTEGGFAEWGRVKGEPMPVIDILFIVSIQR